jgi:hypothetical protein
MTKKDYIAVANIIKDRRPLAKTSSTEAGRTGIYVANDVLDGLASDFADVFANDNPRFDRQRFMDACK